MNLKEANHYNEFLKSLLIQAELYICQEQYFTKITQKHLRSKADPDAADEMVVLEAPVTGFTCIDAIRAAEKILLEQETLINAIDIAKATAEINIDIEIAMNRKRQAFAKCLDSLAQIRPGTKISQKAGRCFNAYGNQIHYIYYSESVTSCDFDRSSLLKLRKELLKTSDEISARVNMLELEIVVDFIPSWNADSSFEEIAACFHD